MSNDPKKLFMENFLKTFGKDVIILYIIYEKYHVTTVLSFLARGF